ncbi:hypothetical protein EJ05DRAFT_471188 [Pseudovirgaria hyperparasitica]|uniref:Zn(2)-C6 fungal-type domain-containing protein n=1 Tax=Pseudovirgaria hyperparasitica TaxID=470096 RepID=A0A6A6VRG3_9PEZI|nr:uncharacterized protein EJ05DRAFT_471188 [Pseudovirgaria hyperparasitica]KAF2752745.1 hypothetical protein EJ05DRAFT_471188 [Pseudovirgaria hyperparasitica]
MLSSTAHHDFPPALGHIHIPSSGPGSLGHDHVDGHAYFAPLHMAHAGFDVPAHSSQHSYQFEQHQKHPRPIENAFVKHRQYPYYLELGSGPGLLAAAGPQTLGNVIMTQARAGRAMAAASVRRRISRACDQCNQLRTKCDGKSPCAHCVEFVLTCEYVRERKKRGKASRKDIAIQQAAAVNATVSTSGSKHDGTFQTSPRATACSSSVDQDGDEVAFRDSSAAPEQDRDLPSQLLHQSRSRGPSNDHDRSYNVTSPVSRSVSLSGADSIPVGGMLQRHHHHPQSHQMSNVDPRLSNDVSMALNGYGHLEDFSGSMMSSHAAVNEGHNDQSTTGFITNSVMRKEHTHVYPEDPYIISPSREIQHQNVFQLPPGESPISTSFLKSASTGGSPAWYNIGSPSTGMYGNTTHIPTQGLRYPVLQPLLPHLNGLLPTSISCDLLELYFQSSSCAFIRPLSPYVLGYVLRKRSFLRQMNPRACSPALLASILWIGAQTSESPFLTTPPSARGKICQKLLELTISLLRPLIHSPVATNDTAPSYAANTVVNGVALGGFGVAMSGQSSEINGSPGAAGNLDDVITYMHLAIVVSASEYKAASLRWWNAAWSLARELKLGRELPPNTVVVHDLHPEQREDDVPGGIEIDVSDIGHIQDQPGCYSEEEREERRRIWWLLYIMDRHLALCYNRPLFLLDLECDGLLQPVDDCVWQSGEFYIPESSSTDPNSNYLRQRGPTFHCTGHSIFGYFLPLMTILGGIVDLNHARNHPRFGLRNRNGREWDEQAAEITQQLEAYEHSLQHFEERFCGSLKHDEAANGSSHNAEVHSPSTHSIHSSSSRTTDQILQTKIVVVYGTHVMHTLHILLNGKWDPISLLDDNDLWISSQAFVTATGHAVDAAKAIRNILDCDPDLSFMPFFFGIYLLQGSFLLLLIADKLQEGATPSIVEACETIVRAHEVCVVTLNTEYQVCHPIHLSPEHASILHLFIGGNCAIGTSLVLSLLTFDVEEFPKSHAVRFDAGSRARRLRGTTVAATRGLSFVPLDR